ncbi:uncharacterized protein LOC142224444 [Haematobia irritans]|uniref:uncharacterized protein LOC142224444 n=1 Tax=Haematobia irritans TaxID=7368 RepID=UPI003F5037F5
MSKSLMVILLILWSILWPIEASVRFTNLKCEQYHPEFAKFLTCRLKVMRRGLISLNVDLKLFQVPVTNTTVNLSLHKKVSGYRLFLYNTTFDFCKFMLNRKQEPFAKLFFDVLEKDSNINYTCPYSHNIIVDNMTVDENIFKYLPLPAGGYMFQLKFAAYNDWKTDVKAYIEIDREFGKFT